MGIPSYYKTLCDRVPGLLSKDRKGSAVTHCWIDFNCMVYHCLRRPGAVPYPGAEQRIEWERQLIAACVAYLKHVVKTIGPTTEVFVAVDGVVPMAKLRQQRLRRFKSLWTAAEEVRLGKSSGGERWDSNAITPGTAFMERLCAALKEIRTEGISWVISGADEPGEGEQKLMNRMRKCPEGSVHCVYGMDADLIVLSLLQPVKELWLIREAQECGETVYTALNQEEYRYFNVAELRGYLCAGRDSDYLWDYCIAMSLLGNDFLPHSLTFAIKENGHALFLRMLDDVRCGGQKQLLDVQNLGWTTDGLLGCLEWLAEREDIAMETHCATKAGKRYQPARGTTPQEVSYDEWNKTPLRQCEELALVANVKKDESNRTVCSLKDTWKDIYYNRWITSLEAERTHICQEYLRGLDWIVKYYMGCSVSTQWCFPWLLPPLWSDIAQTVRDEKIRVAPPPHGPIVQPQEQLAMVLPLASWWLIRDTELKELPKKAPQFWPSGFELFMAGRTLMWEAEARIPLLTHQRLRVLRGDGT
jgi:5'-3' exonuclease